MAFSHGKKTERQEILLDSFDKIYITAVANKEGVSVGRLFRTMLEDFKKKYRENMTDEEYKEFLDYMLVLSQFKGR